jgi:hypothetical protein
MNHEGLSKEIKIWQINIWDTLLKFCTHDPNRKYQIEYNNIEKLNKILDINSSPLTVMIDGKTVQKLEAINKKSGETPAAPINLKDQGQLLLLIDCRLDFDQESREIIVSITNTTDDFVTIDLDQHKDCPFEISDKKTHLLETVITQETTNLFSGQENRILDLDNGETFTWFFPIDQCEIEKKIKTFFSENTNKDCFISKKLEFQIQGISVSCNPQFIINKNNLQKNKK